MIGGFALLSALSLAAPLPAQAACETTSEMQCVSDDILATAVSELRSDHLATQQDLRVAIEESRAATSAQTSIAFGLLVLVATVAASALARLVQSFLT